MDTSTPLYIQIFLPIIIVGGAIAVVMAIVALGYAIRLGWQITDIVDRSKDSFVRMVSLAEGAITQVKQAVHIARLIKGVVSTLQRNRGRGKK